MKNHVIVENMMFFNGKYKFFWKIKRFLLKIKINWYIMELFKSHETKGDHNNECCLVEILH